MKTENNIFIAFLLNLSFSIFEFSGGILTGSVAIMSDAMHDLGDAIAIGISYFLERKSQQQPDEMFTYGYARYSILGSIIVSGILVFGSVIIIYNAIERILHPVSIDYNGMILFAIVGVALNFLAAYITHNGDSLNQKAVNLHMLEDMLGWIVVLVGGVIMRYTDISILDPILSICVALFILFHAVQNLKEVLCIFLEKAPCGLSAKDIEHYISTIDGISDVHHIHIKSIDPHHHYATMHIVTDEDPYFIKKRIREKLKEHSISHVTLELEHTNEICCEEHCYIEYQGSNDHCHHH